MNTLKDIIADASEQIHIPIGKDERDLFQRYFDELILWNKSISLVSVKSPLDIPVKHFIDSLTVLHFIEKKDAKLLDLGSGAGFPGVPLKIVLKSLNLTLVESSRKKVSFLKNLVRKLELDNVTIVNERIERLAKQDDHRESYDIVISRATFKLSELIERGAPFLSPGGTLIAMKAKNADIELKEASGCAREIGLSHPECHDIVLPISGHKRKILLYKKLS